MPTGFTIQDLYAGKEKSSPRNLKIAEIFKEVGLIEKYGSGVKRAVEEILSSDLPKPEITKISGGINVNIFGNSNVLENVPENVPENRMRIIFDLIKNNKKITVSVIAKKISVNEKTVKRDIAKLKQKGILKRIGPDKGGYWEVVEK